MELDSYPTAALAYAIKSLELADTDEARRFALRVLQGAPTAILALQNTDDGYHRLAFSPNGEWLAVGGYWNGQILQRDGGEPVMLSGKYTSAGFRAIQVGFGRGGVVLVTNRLGEVRLWSIPEGQEVQRKRTFEEGPTSLFLRGDGFFTSTTMGGRELIRWWPLDEGESRLTGSMKALEARDIDPAGIRLAYAVGKNVLVRSLEKWALPQQVLGEHSVEVLAVRFHPDGDSVAAIDRSGKIRIWTTAGSSDRPLRILDAEGAWGLRYSPRGRWLAALCNDGTKFVRLWDLTAPPATKPIVLRNDALFLNDGTFDPTERWLVTAEVDCIAFWPLEENYPRVLEGHEGSVPSVAFTPDGTTLLSASGDGTLRAWPLVAEGREEPRVLLRAPMEFPDIALDPKGKQVVVSGAKGRVFVVPLAGGPTRELKGFSERAVAIRVALAPDGRRVAVAPYQSPTEDKVIRIWDLENSAVRILPIPGAGEGFDGGIYNLVFLGEDGILASSYRPPRVLLFDLRDGGEKALLDDSFVSGVTGLAASRIGRFGLASDESGKLVRFELDGSGLRKLASYQRTAAVA